MNFKELFEGVEPKMPGAPSGIQIMTPQQFVAKAGDMPGEESDDKLDEGPNDGKEDNFTIDDIKQLEKIRDFEHDMWNY